MRTPSAKDYRDCCCDPEKQAIAGVVTPHQGKRTDKYLRHRNKGALESDNAFDLHTKPTIRAGKA